MTGWRPPGVRVLHEGQPLATDVEMARSLPAKVRGLMFRSSVPDDYALVFPFGRVARRSVHMLFVRTPLDVVWVADETVTKRASLHAWRGFGWGRADTIIELAPGAATEVTVGDRVSVVGSR